ncbi:MAG: ribosome small subunit-dependent GTPase A [Spirochaetaceae bacterium]|nr:MAG: ribosome small subunit-dependent GTPase A [Spirochaetaceae bacterium]
MVLFLDSGVGGLVYLEEFRRRNRGVPCEYIADTAWFPYGERPPAEVRRRVLFLVEHWMQKSRLEESPLPGAVVIACNTASVVALEALRLRFPVPFVGVVPAVKPGAESTSTGHIALLATARTADDPYTDELVQRFARYCRVTRIGLPRLVEATERGFCGTAEDVARVFREDALARMDSSVDTVVLACTHFVRHRDLFRKILGPGVRITDSLEGVVRRVESILREGGTDASGRDRGRFLHTGTLPSEMECLEGRYRVTPFSLPEEMRATVLWGANNIYSLRTSSGEILEHLRIKGKVLPGTEEGEYNPLAPGDEVTLVGSGSDRRILERRPRRNLVRRWNRKRRALQAIAANVDTILVVSSATDPPYRPGFVDRVLVMAELEGIPAAIVLNKADYSVPPEVERHLTILEELGYPLYRTIAGGDGESLPEIPLELRRYTAGTVTVLVGRSGVGKSSLINHLVPEADLTTGATSRKYSRGRHTTTLARQVVASDPKLDGAIYIDTPGVREFDLVGYSCTEMAAGFREFLPLIPHCRMPGCTHLHEPDCAVRNGVASGSVAPERYLSYRILAESLLKEFS